MANQYDLNNAAQGNLSNAVVDFSVTPKQTDGATGQEETEYQNNDWTKQYGYFCSNGDLKSAIIAKSIWVVGKGWNADADAKVILDNIKGNGKESFDDILFNMDVTRRMSGDSFAEIITDPDTETILNLKVLDPSTIKIIQNKKGIIERYEQTAKYPNDKLKNKIKNLIGLKQHFTFKPEEIFHLSNNRIADNIHGTSDLIATEDILKADMESFVDIKKLMHRQARPLLVFKLKTDDPTTIANFAAKMDKATADGENIYIPNDENAVSFEVVQVTPNPAVFQWRDELRKKFYRNIGLPELLPSGGGDATESGGKIGYLAFEQVVEREQRYIEQQVWEQLNLRINLIPPATLSNDLKQDEAKDPNVFQPSDTQAGVGK